MKKKTPKPSIAWDDDAPVTTAPAKPAKVKKGKHVSQIKFPKEPPKNSIKEREAIDDLIGEPPKVTNVPVPIKSVAVDRGCYMDANSGTAIVISTVGGRVQFMFFGTAGVEYSEQSVDVFMRRYVRALPHYPIRRAARLYMDSPQPKDDKSERLLRSLLRS